MEKKQPVAVVIPIYKSVLDADELLSLAQCIKVLDRYPIIFFGPEQLDTSVYQAVCKNRIKFEMKFFDPLYFADVEGYNKIMLSPAFYQRFINYRHILIYQLDAWIFKDDLQAWCNKNYDYIGAPWVNWDSSAFVAGHATILRTVLSKLGYKNFNLVGNGGLSLRKVKTCIINLKILKKIAKTFDMNEDYFFSFLVTSYNPFFRIPRVDDALKFSFDSNPRQAFELNHYQLPMGCHAWPKHKDFWQQYVQG